MKCPKCNSPMTVISYEGIEVDRCTHCSGLWFDMLEAEDLKKLSGSEAIDSASARALRAERKVAIRCPHDSASMLRMVVNNQPHIWYEACPICHGTYFDAGEFRDFKAETFMDIIRDALSGERK